MLGGQIDGMSDDVLDEIDEQDNKDQEKETLLTINNTNARSLCPKNPLFHRLF